MPGLGRSPGGGKGSTPVFWPGEFHGLYSPWARKESDMTERLSLSGYGTLKFCLDDFPISLSTRVTNATTDITPMARSKAWVGEGFVGTL